MLYCSVSNLYKYIQCLNTKGNIISFYTILSRYHIYYDMYFLYFTHVNEEQIITGYQIDGAIGSLGDFGSYRWFVYITTLLLREASWLLYCIVGHPKPASAPSILLVLLEPHCFKILLSECTN